MIGIAIVSIPIIILAIVVVMGKGDKLIAGYNTASEEEKSKVNIKRLRWVVAITLVLTIVALFVPYLIGQEESTTALIVTTFAMVYICIMCVILANTWCMKK